MSLFRTAAPPAVADERRSFVLPIGPASSAEAASAAASTVPGALQSVAVGATVDLICSLASELPLDVFSGEGSSRRKRPTPDYLEDPAGDGTGVEDWIYQVLMSWVMRGNLFGDILERSRGGGFPTQVALYYPDDVKGREVDGRVRWTVKGREVTDPGNFLHRRVSPVPGHVLGRSPISQHAATVGVSLAATSFGGQWFASGAHPTALLTTDADLTETKAKTAKERFMAVMAGRREPLILGNGWDFKPLQMNPEESQFLETQGYSEAQCARIFGPGFAEILGYESGGNLTYANIESRATHLLVFGMSRWLRRVDRLLTSMLPRPQYARLNRDAMLETTTLTRYQTHALALANRWKVVNEVRNDEDMPPVAWGDEPNQPAATAPAPADGGK